MQNKDSYYFNKEFRSWNFEIPSIYNSFSFQVQIFLLLTYVFFFKKTFFLQVNNLNCKKWKLLQFAWLCL